MQAPSPLEGLCRAKRLSIVLREAFLNENSVRVVEKGWGEGDIKVTMHNFNPYFTNDGSVGLYSDTDNDVYHSTFGALTESYEKFILPANFPKYFQKNNEIKILDLCFGIGYNTKSYLNYLIDFLNIETIDTDNIKYNDKIYTDNAKYNFTKCLPCKSGFAYGQSPDSEQMELIGTKCRKRHSVSVEQIQEKRISLIVKAILANCLDCFM